MGTFDTTGPRSGRTYGFNIQGDAPTDYEYAWISNYIQEQEEEYSKFYEQQLGKPLPEIDDGTAIGRGFRRGFQTAKGGVGELLESAGQLSGLEYLESLGSDIEESARQRAGELSISEPSANYSYKDVVADPSLDKGLTYAGEILGGSLPFVGAGVAGAAAGAVLPFATAGVGATAGLGTLFLGQNLQSREEIVGEDNITGTDFARAAGTALFQAKLDTIGLKVLGKLLGGGQIARTVANEQGQGFAARLITGAGTGLAVEGSTEVVQELAGLWQAGYDLDTPEVEEILTEAFIAGGLLGTGIGGVGRAAFGKRKEPEVTEDSRTTDATEIEVKEDSAATIAGNLDTDEKIENRAEEIKAEEDAAQPEADAETDEEFIAKRAKFYEEFDRLQKTGLSKKEAAKIMEDRSYSSFFENLTAAEKDFFIKRYEINKEMLEKNQVTSNKERTLRARGEDDARSKSKRTGTGDANRRPSVAGTEGAGGRDTNTEDAVSPNTGGVGTDLSTVKLPNVAKRKQSTTVKKDKKEVPKFTSTRKQTIEENSTGELETKTDEVPTEVTKELLDNLGVTQNAAIRRRITGKPITDKDVQRQLLSYGNNAIIRRQVPDYQTKLNELLTSLPEVEPEVDIDTDTDTDTEVEEDTDTDTDTDIEVEEDTNRLTGRALAEDIAAKARDPERQKAKEKEALEFDRQVAEAEAKRKEQELEDKAYEEAGEPIGAEYDAWKANYDAQKAAKKDSRRSGIGKGEETGAPAGPGQFVPEGIRPVEKEPTLEELNIDASEEAQNQRLRDIEERVKQRNLKEDAPIIAPLKETYAAWWQQNNDKVLRDFVYERYDAPASDPALKLPVVFSEDVTKTLTLLGTTRFTRGTGALGKPAKLYFSKIPSVIEVLDLIAYDAAGVIIHQSGKSKGQPVATYRKNKQVDDGENAFFEGTGNKNGLLAYEWVQNNLSDTARQWLEARAGMYIRFSNFIKVRQAAQTRKDERLEFDKDGTEATDLGTDIDSKANLQKHFRAFFLGRDAVVPFDVPMHPSVTRALDSGRLDLALQTLAANNVQAAIDGVAATEPEAKKAIFKIADSPMLRAAKLSAALSKLVGSTKVEIVDRLPDPDSVGMFTPETNTISLVRDGGLHQHVVLHEMMHAVVSHMLDAKTPVPEVAQLNSLFLQIKDDIGEFYGSKDLQEFVAEALSNPQFQTHLALTKVDNGTVPAYKKFLRSIINMVRKAMGLQPRPVNSVLDEVDNLVRAIMSPAPSTRAAPAMMMQMTDPNELAGTVKGSLDMIPEGDQKRLKTFMRQSASRSVPEAARRFILNSIPSNIMAKEAAPYIPFAPELNAIIERQSGEMRIGNMVVNNLDKRLGAYNRGNKARYKILEGLIPLSTFNRVDMSLPRKVYSQFGVSFRNLKTGKSTVKYFPTEIARLNFAKQHNKNIDPAKTSKAALLPEPNPDTLLMYDTLQAEYKKLDNQGKKLYREVFDLFEETYDKIIPALESRIAASIGDPNGRAKAMDKLRKMLTEQAGVIRPYAPLMRKGDWRLQYTTIDPDTGGVEVFVEYFQHQGMLEKAADAIRTRNIGLIRQNPNLTQTLNPDTAIEFGKATARRNYDNVPPSSFIFDLLQELKTQGVEGAALDGVIDLVFDALPEKSFMQGFRSRKDVRGYLGDKTPTGALGQQFDLRELVNVKGRDMNKQVTQLKYAAETEAFRRKLEVSGAKENPDTYLMAEKLDQMARFAQSPNLPRWSQQANTLGFATTMGLNFSSAAITFFDVLMSAMPLLSAEYGLGNTAKAYGVARNLFGQASSVYTVRDIGPDGQPRVREIQLGGINKSIGNLDVNAPEVDVNNPLYRYKTAVNMGMERGIFNQSLTGEMLEAGSSPGKAIEAINSISGGLFHHSERLNRETTYIAKYELELQKREKSGPLTDQDYIDAAEAAIDFTNFSLGSTAAAGRPIWAQSGVGNILFLFKRFAVGKYYLMYRLAKDSIGAQIDADPNLTPEQKAEMKRIARKALFNFLFTTGVVTGVGGMPLMGFFGMLYDMFRDEEDEQFEEMMRNNLGEFYYGGLANELLGVDIADRISMNSLLYREPIVGKDQPMLYTMFEQLGGPVVGYYLGTERAITDFSRGEYRRGVEGIAPVAIRNFMKAERYATEGALTRRRDPIVEDLSPYNIITQAFGFAPQHLGLAMDINRLSRRRDQALKDKKTNLLRRLNMARRERDTAEYQQVLKEIREYNAGLPEESRRDTSKVISPDSIKASARSFETTTANMRRGITYTPTMREIAEQFD